VPQTRIDDPLEEGGRLAAALEAADRSIASRQERLRSQLSPGEVSIFDAHRLILQDPELLARTTARIEGEHLSAAAAWQASIAETAQAYLELDDAYLQARHVDVLEVGNQVLRILLGENGGETIGLSNPGILFAEELSPGETASLEPELVLGLVTASGGPTSHQRHPGARPGFTRPGRHRFAAAGSYGRGADRPGRRGRFGVDRASRGKFA